MAALCNGVNVPHQVTIYPHNGLLNLAYFNLEIINRNSSNKEFEGMALHCMNCIISIAFAVEAVINYIGSNKVVDWNGRTKWYKKVQQVCKVTGFKYDLQNYPLSTIEKIKSIRNDMAHGKPIVKTVRAKNGAELKCEMASLWDEYLTPEFTNMAYEHTNQFINELSVKSDITLFDTLTKAVGEYKQA